MLDLTAKVEDVAYHSQKMWIDIKHFVLIKQEMYAKACILKRTELSEVRKYRTGGFPLHCFIRMLKDGKSTEFKMRDIKFDQKIPKYIFTKEVETIT